MGRQAQKLLRLRQGSRSVADYSIEFHILAMDSRWNESMLVALFRERLSTEVQLELECNDAGKELAMSISLAITLDHHL